MAISSGYVPVREYKRRSEWDVYDVTRLQVGVFTDKVG